MTDTQARHRTSPSGASTERTVRTATGIGSENKGQTLGIVINECRRQTKITRHITNIAKGRREWALLQHSVRQFRLPW